MKKTIKYITGVAMIAILFTACSKQQDQQSLEELVNDSKQQEKVLDLMVDDHDISSTFISKMMENDHATGMMVDKLVLAASEDSMLAVKLSNMITKYPDLMLLTTHHFMPVINDDEHLCDGFCDHAMEQTNIADEMCHKMQAKEEMNCCGH